MPQTATPETLEFLDELHLWIARGRPAYEFAKQKEIANGTITYRLNAYGLEAKRCVGLVDKRTGALYPELKRQGEIVPAPVVADNEPAGAVA